MKKNIFLCILTLVFVLVIEMSVVKLYYFSQKNDEYYNDPSENVFNKGFDSGYSIGVNDGKKQSYAIGFRDGKVEGIKIGKYLQLKGMKKNRTSTIIDTVYVQPDTFYIELLFDPKFKAPIDSVHNFTVKFKTRYIGD